MAKEKGLSERQKSILRFIHESMTRTKRPPTIRELCSAANIPSTSVVNYNLEKLETAGYVLRDAEVSRGVRLTEKAFAWLQSMGEVIAAATDSISRLVSIPLVGTIAAGTPIITNTSGYTADDVVEVSSAMLPDAKDLFALRVKGDSMIDAMVNDGDLVIMKSQKLARNGEMVAVWLEDEESTTLKYFYHEGEQIRLQPANPTMSPIYVNPASVQIQGRVVMVLRQTV